MIRYATPDDIEDMVSIFIDAYNFPGPRESVKSSFEISLEVQPDGCLLAFLKDEPVGMGCIFFYNKQAWIGLMGVKKAYQRRGIGTEVFRRLLEIGRRKVDTIRLDASSQGYGLYKKFKFVDEYRTVRYELMERPIKRVEGVVEVNKIPNWVKEIDKKAFGDDRIRVLEAYMRRGARLLCAENEGFGLVYRGKIGPLVADSPRVAEKILLKAFQLGAREIIIPEVNKDALELIKIFKPSQVTSCMRMRLGSKIEEKVDIYYGILAYAKG
ncbi:TPA: GNAT family N-acetyltransferase [Pyrococcus horikoshii]|uniref:GNAT family N-acetyltransferase n=1 Tax=Pyrococcus horikoshii TaxID=53953 RepID=A0A832W897_PYRHR|nr:GNAT family N-acetyltransferase [Pyrococcus horikoshii]